MGFKALSEGATVNCEVTRAGTDPEQRFRFCKPHPPYSAEKNVHISWPVIQSACISLEDLNPGVTIRLLVKPSIDRQGKPSWSAEWVQLAPDFKPDNQQTTHLGVIDEGGVQHLQKGDAWFLENVIPTIKRDKVIVSSIALTKSAQTKAQLLMPGTIMMFNFDGHRYSSGDLYDPVRLKSGLLIEALTHLRSMSHDQIASTVLEVIHRGDHVMLDEIWHRVPSQACERIFEGLQSSGELEKLGPAYPDGLVEAAFMLLPPSEALALCPNNPVAWKHPETAAILCAEKIAQGAGLEEIVELCVSMEASIKVWPLLATSHSGWVIEQASDSTLFERLPSLLGEDALHGLLGAFAGANFFGKFHLLQWLPDSILRKWLEQFIDDSFEPVQELVDALAIRVEHSSMKVPMALEAWAPAFWDPPNRTDLLRVIDHHHRRLLTNRNDGRSLALIAEAIGLLLHTQAGDFNDPDKWGHKPADWVDHVIDIVREFPEIDTEIQVRSAFGTWNEKIGFEGPSRVWLHRNDLSAGWLNFAPNDKILAIYLRLSLSEPMPVEIITDEEKHTMVRALLTLIDGARQDERSEIAVYAHNLITEAVLKRVPAPGSRAAVSPDELVIDFDRALPRCGVLNSGVKFCEGNHISKPSFEEWKKHKNDPINYPKPRSVLLTPVTNGYLECHCPRLERAHGYGYAKSGCPVEMGAGEGKARLFARDKLPWTQWSLLEALHALGYPSNLISYFNPSGIKPKIMPERIVHNEYVNKVAAVANRINDLRDRLRCGWRDGAIDKTKGCGQPLSPNFSYRVFPAAYGITVVGGCTSCEAGPHDKGAYFNHCKRCISILDSRESPVKDDSGINTFVCVHCGGWGQDGKGEFRKCGKCGSYNSEPKRGNKVIRCRDCNHTWNPLDKYWPTINDE